MERSERKKNENVIFGAATVNNVSLMEPYQIVHTNWWRWLAVFGFFSGLRRFMSTHSAHARTTV